MTPEEKQQYIDKLRLTEGKGLEGAEAMLWDAVQETSETLKRGRGTLDQLRRQTVEVEQTLLRVTGRHQGALDMLTKIEEQRRQRDAEAAEAIAIAEEEAKRAVPEPLPPLPRSSLPSVSDCLSELNDVVSKAKNVQPPGE